MMYIVYVVSICLLQVKNENMKYLTWAHCPIWPLGPVLLLCLIHCQDNQLVLSKATDNIPTSRRVVNILTHNVKLSLIFSIKIWRTKQPFLYYLVSYHYNAILVLFVGRISTIVYLIEGPHVDVNCSLFYVVAVIAMATTPHTNTDIFLDKHKPVFQKVNLKLIRLFLY